MVRKETRFAVLAAALAAFAFALIAAAGAPGTALAQQPSSQQASQQSGERAGQQSDRQASQQAGGQASQGVERKILMRQDLSMPGWESVMIQTTIQPGGKEGWHTHPGTLVEYILQGPWTMETRGKPTGHYQTGETFSIVEGQVHQAINPGKTAVRGLAILTVDKSKPMTTQVP